MKKLLLVMLVVLNAVFLLGPVYAADRACQSIWDDVAGHSFTWTVGEDTYRIEFSDSYVGPCPQGIVEIYDGFYIAPRLTLPYISGDDFVILHLGEDTDLKLLLTPVGLEQIVFPPDRIILEKVEK